MQKNPILRHSKRLAGITRSSAQAINKLFTGLRLPRLRLWRAQHSDRDFSVQEKTFRSERFFGAESIKKIGATRESRPDCVA
jgi:hypothetical protein